MNDTAALRIEILKSFGADDSQVRGLLAYNQTVFNLDDVEAIPDFPLPDEPFVSTWIGYAEECSAASSILPLWEHIEQLHNVSLSAPKRCRLMIHQTPAGRIPLLIAGVRADFVTLAQAFSKSKKPIRIPHSMGACTIGRSKKDTYRDRFIILSDGPYSDVLARDMGFIDEEWRAYSLVIRREHECTHYFTRRVLSSMRAKVFDELLADYAGIVAVLGVFKASWFLRFIGLEAYPTYRQGGRLENYCGDLTISDTSFVILQWLVKAAAENLEAADQKIGREFRDLSGQAVFLIGLASLTLEELASDIAVELICDRVRRYQRVRQIQ